MREEDEEDEEDVVLTLSHNPGLRGTKGWTVAPNDDLAIATFLID